MAPPANPERFKTQGNAALPWSAARTQYPQLLASKEPLIIAQYGFKKDRESIQYPLFPVGTTEAQYQLFQPMYSGEDYRHPFIAPPDIPAGRLAAMRRAFADAMADPAFAAAMKTHNLDPDPVSRQELQDLTTTLYDTPMSVLKRMRDVTSSSMK